MFALLHELEMLRVILIFVLRPFRLKVEIQGDLVTLIDHRAVASRRIPRRGSSSRLEWTEGIFWRSRRLRPWRLAWRDQSKR